MEIIWTWSLQFGLHPAYKVSILIDAMTFTFDLDKQ
jgi:hypothetical protein